MITLKNVRTLDGQVINFEIPSSESCEIEGAGKLLLFPGIIDPDICFGSTDSPNWNAAVESSIKGGITTTIEIPVAILPHNAKNELEQKKRRIAKALLDLKIPLNHFDYLLYTNENLEETDKLGTEKQIIKGIVLQLDPEKNDVLDDKWDHLFRLAAQEDLPVIINAHNENSKHRAKEKKGGSLMEKAIYYVEKWSNRLLVLNVATKNEIDLIQKARDRALLIFAETSPQHLFHGDPSQSNHLWEALNNNIIETIGSGYNVNHKSKEKISYHGKDYSLSDPIFLLPLLLTAVNEKKITLDKLTALTSHNIRDILELNKTPDYILIDMEKEQTIKKIQQDRQVDIKIKGWPAYTIIKGHIFPAS